MCVFIYSAYIVYLLCICVCVCCIYKDALTQTFERKGISTQGTMTEQDHPGQWKQPNKGVHNLHWKKVIWWAALVSNLTGQISSAGVKRTKIAQLSCLKGPMLPQLLISVSILRAVHTILGSGGRLHSTHTVLQPLIGDLMLKLSPSETG